MNGTCLRHLFSVNYLGQNAIYVFADDAYNYHALICRREPHVSTQATLKKAANLSINADLLREAKSLDINLSQAFEIHLAELVKAKRQEKWLEENRKAIDAYNRYVDEHGVYSDGWQAF
jgi:antitoxin CcdA